MSKMKLSLVATALVGSLALAGTSYAADPLEKIHAAEGQIHKAAAQSQAKIDSIQEQTQELIFEYRDVVAQIEINKVYNDHVAKLVAAQNEDIASLESQIAEIENTKRNVVPLMYRMIDMLEQFVAADIPIKLDIRKDRVAKLRDVMVNPNVSTSEKYRQVLEAYQIEKDYGSAVEAWQATETFDSSEPVTADFVHVGRIALIAQSKDLKNAWVWNNSSRSWQKVGDEYLKDITKTIRMARKQAPLDLIKLPIFAAE
jgi:DNA-binding ferritin-like protein (Dps family)